MGEYEATSGEGVVVIHWWQLSSINFSSFPTAGPSHWLYPVGWEMIFNLLLEEKEFLTWAQRAQLVRTIWWCVEKLLE